LKFSTGANLLLIANPLASVSLPSPAPALGVTAGGSVHVDGSWTISTDYQVRVQRLDTSRVRLGWYHKHNSEFSVSATAGAGIQGGTPDTDLFQSFIAAISSNAAADRNELRTAGLSATQIGAINDAVAGAVNRKLELSVAAEFGSLAADEAAFLYEIDLTTLGADGKQAVHAALGGDLSGLADAGALPAGIREVRSILSRARVSRFRLKVNLLGIFNFASVSQLALNGTVTFMRRTRDRGPGHRFPDSDFRRQLWRGPGQTPRGYGGTTPDHSRLPRQPDRGFSASAVQFARLLSARQRYRARRHPAYRRARFRSRLEHSADSGSHDGLRPVFARRGGALRRCRCTGAVPRRGRGAA
jgi:hypothetical protein